MVHFVLSCALHPAPSPKHTPTPAPTHLASYRGLAIQWDYGVMAVLTYIDVFHPVIFRV